MLSRWVNDRVVVCDGKRQTRRERVRLAGWEPLGGRSETTKTGNESAVSTTLVTGHSRCGQPAGAGRRKGVPNRRDERLPTAAWGKMKQRKECRAQRRQCTRGKGVKGGITKGQGRPRTGRTHAQESVVTNSLVANTISRAPHVV